MGRTKKGLLFFLIMIAAGFCLAKHQQCFRQPLKEVIAEVESRFNITNTIPEEL